MTLNVDIDSNKLVRFETGHFFLSSLGQEFDKN
jgi:hypothetical protein